MKIVLRADRTRILASRSDLSYVMAELQDDAGNPIEDGVKQIHFTIKGVGELAGVASANPKEMSSFRVPHYQTFHGRCLAILRPTGEKGSITLEAQGENLSPATITVDAG